MKVLLEQAQILRHRLLRGLGDRERAAIRMRRRDGLFEIEVDGETFLAPGPRRWRLYRRGVEARLEAVAARYGLAGLSPREPGEWAVDVGGYMGEWSLHMLRRGFRVLAIEPDPEAARCLKANLTRHAPQGAEWLHDPRVALDAPREVTFHSAPSNADGSIFASDKHASRALTLQGERLDAILAERIGEARAGVLKMDAEGAEPEVLAGAPELLGRLRRVGIDAGAERAGDSTVEACRRILAEAGFGFPEGLAPSSEVVAAAREEAG
ncbi:MAG: FkbM family methyltransferase [Pseudomonadota bacterium]